MRQSGRSLVTLERVWRQREDRMRQGVLAALAEAGGLKGRVAMLRAALADRSEVMRAALDGGDGPGDASGYRRQVSEIRCELTREARRLAVAEQVLASRRMELASAIKQRRSLHRLSRKRSAARAARWQRRQEKEMDDLHAARATGQHEATRQGTTNATP